MGQTGVSNSHTVCLKPNPGVREAVGNVEKMTVKKIDGRSTMGSGV